jgi:hypothetical protein
VQNYLFEKDYSRGFLRVDIVISLVTNVPNRLLALDVKQVRQEMQVKQQGLFIPFGKRINKLDPCFE